MIIEGLLTTCDGQGEVNVAPMGPVVTGDFETLTLRPFPGSTTYRNLLETRCGVFHVVDRVNVLAEAAVSTVPLPPHARARSVNGVVLEECCRWFEFRVRHADESGERAVLTCDITHRGRRRDYLGLNRARHAVVEAAVLATRVHLLPEAEVIAELDRLRSPVIRTGDDEEIAAFEMLDKFVRRHYHQQS